MAEVVVPQPPFMASPVDRRSAPGPQSFTPTGEGVSFTEAKYPHTYPLQPPTVATAPASYPISRPAEETDLGRSIDRSRPQHLSFHALPAFEFNPSGSSNPASSSSACTPTRRTPPCSNSTAVHRRNGSEFIGGDGKIGMTAPASTSPTKGDFGLEVHPIVLSGPPVSRRGHAHRRSGAVSSNDLSNLWRPAQEPAEEPRGNSLPSTPSDPNHHSRFMSHLNRSPSQPGPLVASQDNHPIPFHDENAPARTHPRARVGFSDTVEFIPRPLSTISSETSSSLSTIRAAHSVTGSISSIVSGGTSSPPSAKLGRSLSDPTLEQSPTRSSHKTTLSLTPGERECSEVSDAQISLQHFSQLAQPGSQQLANGASTFSVNSVREYEAQYANTLTDDALETNGQASPLPLYARGKLSHFKPSSTTATLTRPRSSPEPKVGKRQKSVKTWAESFLPRKPRTDEAFQSNPEPADVNYPQVTFATVDDISLENISFDDDTTCVIRDPSQFPPSPRIVPGQARVASTSDEGDISNSMLDLDAAFGDAHNFSPGSDFEDTSEGGFCAARRRMHSSGATGGFSGPGMHYHRRAESAPEMAQFDYHRLGFPRFGSNPTMADVFEEDEEDDEDEEIGHGRGESQLNISTHQSSPSAGHTEDITPGLGVKVVDVEMSHEEQLRHTRSRKTGCNSGEENQRRVIENEAASDIRSADATVVEDAPVEIVEADEEPRASTLSKTSEDYEARPTPSIKPVLNRPVSAPIDFALPKASLPSMTPETLSSAVSSPDFSRTSFDVPRLHTANSSITDRATLNSYRVGDHNFNLCASVDDVPSLTGSASTAASAQPPRFSSSAYTRSSAERSSSLSAAVPLTSRPAAASSKRSSLASLSRLVGNSYGERSKLHIEERAQVEKSEKTDKKKHNRINRLMRFWKSRGKANLP